MPVRRATPRDRYALSVTFAEAFASDPVWSWAFPDHAAMQVWWRFWIDQAVPHDCIWCADDGAAAAIWIPPGRAECAPEDEPHIDALVEALAPARAPAILETLERFDAHHPRDEPHFYLSLLGTANAHRGAGIGMALLRDNLATIDDLGAPAYLESSNPVNIPRYESVGFRAVGAFTLPDDRTTVTTMWRDASAR